jgi:hypothetical protein
VVTHFLYDDNFPPMLQNSIQNGIFWECMIGLKGESAAARWQHVSQICFATFIWSKIAKLLKTQQPLKLEQN